MEILGIDIGGSGMKGAIINTTTGELISERFRIPTPRPASPKLMKETIKEIVSHFKWKECVGCTFPAVVINGKAITAGNLSPKWINVKIDQTFSKVCGGLPFYIANDADLAGVAEMQLGKGKNLKGKVAMVTIGTGIGSGVFYDGQLIPNFELGRMYHTDGKIVEAFAADSARKREDLKLEEWAKRFDIFLNYLNTIITPEYIILGGGISKKFDKFKEHLTIKTPIEVAHFRNNAGIIGAAIYAKECHYKK